jgi:hypothetical protein
MLHLSKSHHFIFSERRAFNSLQRQNDNYPHIRLGQRGTAINRKRFIGYRAGARRSYALFAAVSEMRREGKCLQE